MTDRRLGLTVEALTVRTVLTGAAVVEDVSFSLSSGEILGLVGESGSGKTTLALALLGYARRGLRIASGRILVGGEDMVGASREHVRAMRGARVSYVPQDPATALNPALRVGTQIFELFRASGFVGGDARRHERVGEVLEEVGLDANTVLSAYPHQLSGGQQQRVGLAMAFLLHPALIVLDEPTTGLDVTTQKRVLDTIRSMCASHGTAGVFVSHDLAVIRALVDHVAVMYAGAIAELGANDEVFGNPRHPYTRALLRAVPSTERSHRLMGLAGYPPGPLVERHGCSFAARCEFAQQRCTSNPPEFARVGTSDHSVRCVRTHELGVVGARLLEDGALADSRATTDAPVLSAAGLRASYGHVEVLHDVSCSVNRRECLAVAGESGSGKTTLARCLVGLHRRWSGEVRLGIEVLATTAAAREREQLRAVQFVFQNPYGSLNPRRSVRRILEQPLRQFFSLDRGDRDRRVADSLEAASLPVSFLNRYPAELSGGERQRVAIARALVVSPDVLVCDEITSALDVSVQADIIEVLRSLQLDRGLAIVFITHNLALVRSIAQRLVVMQNGAVIEDGETEAVLRNPGAEYTQRLLADVPRLA